MLQERHWHGWPQLSSQGALVCVCLSEGDGTEDGQPHYTVAAQGSGEVDNMGWDEQENYRPARLGTVGLWGAIKSPAAKQIYRGRESPKSLPGRHDTCRDRLGA